MFVYQALKLLVIICIAYQPVRAAGENAIVIAECEDSKRDCARRIAWGGGATKYCKPNCDTGENVMCIAHCCKSCATALNYLKADKSDFDTSKDEVKKWAVWPQKNCSMGPAYPPEVIKAKCEAAKDSKCKEKEKPIDNDFKALCGEYCHPVPKPSSGGGGEQPKPDVEPKTE